MKDTVDGREVEDFERVLAKTAVTAIREVRGVVEKGALNIKRDAAKKITGLAHARAYPRSITYDVHVTPGSTYADIGPDKDKPQGPLGNLLEYGSVNNPPHPHMRPAADRELPKFEKALELLVVRQLEGR